MLKRFVRMLRSERKSPGSTEGLDESLIELMRGSGKKSPTDSEREISAVARKSVVTARDLTAGCALEEKDLIIKRPGTGIPPKELPKLLGRSLKRDIARDSILSWDDLK